MTNPSEPMNGLNLPNDPDVDVDETLTGTPLPAHLHPAYLSIVFVGGTLGTAARAALTLAFPEVRGVPFSMLVANVVGAFLLGVLLELLTRRGSDEGHRRTLRLLAGTGFMGGFTTYSALASDSAVLISNGNPGVGIGYALITVLVGAAATWAGISVASFKGRSRAGDRS